MNPRNVLLFSGIIGIILYVIIRKLEREMGCFRRYIVAGLFRE